MTDNVKRRLSQHQKGYSPYMRKFFDINLEYCEKYDEIKKAKLREQQLKKWTVAKKKALINGEMDKLVKLSKNREIVDGANRG